MDIHESCEKMYVHMGHTRLAFHEANIWGQITIRMRNVILR